MSINKNRRRSLTDGSRALDLFTDRHELTLLFAEYLNESPRKQILCFYGDSGNGKSLLLKFLREKFCKRFDPKVWERLKQLPITEAARAIKFAEIDDKKTWDVPRVIHDFGAAPVGDERPQDPFWGLVMLRRNLIKAAESCEWELRFPLFDFACTFYLHETGKLDKAKDLFLVLGIHFDSDVSISDFTRFSQARGVSQWEIEKIQSMDLDRELISELPNYLAQGLNEAMREKNAPPRVALFFDTHEAFWGEQKELGGDCYHIRDEWFRKFLCELNLKLRIVVAIAAREAPRWTRFDHIYDHTLLDITPEEFFDLQPVDHLSKENAGVYLRQEGIEIIKDVDLRERLINFASVEFANVEGELSLQVHPLLLGLCADVVLEAEGQDVHFTGAENAVGIEKKTEILVNRLLSYTNINIRYAVAALSACRSFDFALYEQMGTDLNFQTDAHDFEIIIQFPFVWQDRQQSWYRIHNLVRCFVGKTDPEGINNNLKTHEFLENFYRSQDNIPEAIYHANQQDAERGTEEWVKVFGEAVEYSKYDLCRRLLEIRSELWIVDDFNLGKLSHVEGTYYEALSCHNEAQQHYQEAIATYDGILLKVPDYIDTLNNKVSTLKRLGNSQSTLFHIEGWSHEAEKSYAEAITTYERILELSPHDIDALKNKAYTLRTLGNIQVVSLFKTTEAMESYAKAIATSERILELAHDDIDALNNKGNSLQTLGKLQEELSQTTKAMESYANAIATYDEALRLAPNNITALKNKAYILSSLGYKQEELSQTVEALEYFSNAIATYELLELAHDDINTLESKTYILELMGDIQVSLSQTTQALESYAKQVTTYERILKLAPKNTNFLNLKAYTLQTLGELQAELSQTTDAQKSYTLAITAYDQAFALDLKNTTLLKNKAYASYNLGKLQVSLSQTSKAQNSYANAIAAYDRALQLAPDDIYALKNKGNTLQSLGALQAELSQTTDAQKSYTLAIAAYDQAFALDLKNTTFLKNKAYASYNLGKLQARQSQTPEAQKSYIEAIAAYDRVLQLAPDDIYAFDNKGITLQKLGDLQASLSQTPEAQNSYIEAISCYDNALEINPDNPSPFFGKACVFALQGNLKLALENLQKAILLNPEKYLEMAKTDSDFDSIRHDPRFQELIQ